MGHCPSQLDPRSDDDHDEDDDQDDDDYYQDDNDDVIVLMKTILEDDGCEPMKGPRSEPQMMSMHEEHKKIEVGIPIFEGNQDILKTWSSRQAEAE